jgi:hypothetical protein
MTGTPLTKFAQVCPLELLLMLVWTTADLHADFLLDQVWTNEPLLIADKAVEAAN